MIKKTPIAIVGMSGIFPGANDLKSFWKNIINKVDTTREVPPNRWITDPALVYEPKPALDKAYSTRMCLVDNFKLDPVGLDLAPDFINQLDPLYHKVLHVGREAFNSGKTSSINKEKTGIILAAIALPTDASSALCREILGKSYEEKILGRSPSSPVLSAAQCFNSRVTSLPAALLAKALGLKGGSYTLDAACASSLYAIKSACDELYSHRADAMLAGGVSRPDCLYTQIGFSQLQALSPSGRCAPFDASADGLVVGEGAAMVLLKRLEDALRDKDEIHGLIHGIGLSNDIEGNLLAPATEGQLRAIKPAYEASGWSPNDIDLIECHGTGTPVGDAVEIKSLKSFWGKSGWQPGQCAIGSVKSMIGHLLTGAGAAALIKILLSLKHKTLPPSLNFNKAHSQSPLKGSPFRVQTKTQFWKTRDNGPRKAAINAFGFGGINAHVLISEFRSEDYRTKLKISSPEIHSNEPAAIVGMGLCIDKIDSVKDFQYLILNGKNIIKTQSLEFKIQNPELKIPAGKFKIPPNQIPEILPQQLLMLQAAASALENADLPLREKRIKMGAIIGIAFDFQTTNFHLRWNLNNKIKKWAEILKLDLSEKEMSDWLKSLQNEVSPPLNANRTMGALGSIVASRVAREFSFGGPSFSVSGEENSGIHALEIGLRALQQHEMDTVLVGAVDMALDIRNIISTNQIRPYSSNNEIHPLDKSANGTMQGQGASAIIIKRLSDAKRDGDRIYAVIKGIGKSNGLQIAGCGSKDDLNSQNAVNTYKLSFQEACDKAEISPDLISYIETHGSGYPDEDRIELKALKDFYKNQKYPCTLGSVKANTGHMGAASGLFSIVKTALSLYQEIMPPMGVQGSELRIPGTELHLSVFPQFWFRNRIEGPRKAVISSMTIDGACAHVILEGWDAQAEVFAHEKIKPLGPLPYSLFVIEAENTEELKKQLEEFANYVQYQTEKHIENIAKSWFERHGSNFDLPCCISIVANNVNDLKEKIIQAEKAVETGAAQKMNSQSRVGLAPPNGLGGIAYSPNHKGNSGETAFVFPGSGNHYLGMGREIGVQWPEILRKMDNETDELKNQMLPWCYIPWRDSWESGWERDASEKIISDPHNMIFGQVMYGGLMSDLIQYFDIKPSSVISYSLGESSGLFALKAWPDRGLMLQRMLKSNLFKTDLAGPCNAARKLWNIPSNEEVLWTVALVNRPAEIVRKVIDSIPTANLLIVNTSDECVIGGCRPDIETAIKTLNCEAIYLEGVVSVHCEILKPVQKAYRDLHIFPTTPDPDIRFYSSFYGKSYELTPDSAADSILGQAMNGFDFSKIIQQAYDDGVRIFLEMGPNASCTRMINKILKGKDHLAQSSSVKGEDEVLTILKFLGTLAAERIPCSWFKVLNLEFESSISDFGVQSSESGVFDSINKSIKSTAKAHNTFLDFAQKTSNAYAKTLAFQTQLLQTMISDHPEASIGNCVSKPELDNEANELANVVGAFAPTYVAEANIHVPKPELGNEAKSPFSKEKFRETSNKVPSKPETQIAYSRKMCMKFAIGSLADVLGPEFAVVDTYPVRVRLPDEPLMLVDRILSVEGEKGSMTSGKVITEHDVMPEAWYLDNGRAPSCITIEAGQADLFLCSYLGIDLKVKGKRSYRLLDATVEMHRHLPCSSETIRYEINIDKFINQQDTWMFFFRFKGFIDNIPVITMTDGCAGFFTNEEVRNSGGIILSKEEKEYKLGKKPLDWHDPVSMKIESYNDKQLNKLREGDLAGCFGPLFENLNISNPLRLPGKKMKLIDRVPLIAPEGGRFGMGIIRAEADIHPDDWFLTCHFIDDMTMPGTLMYECCAHTLRFFLLRMGWVGSQSEVCYEPINGIKSKMRCRGPVTPETKHVLYEVEIKEIGYKPEPYVIADALMYADKHPVVFFQNMSMQLTGLTQEKVETIWKKRPKTPSSELYSYEQILSFSIGKPSEAFGDPYKIFDSNRFIARFPGPPYLFLSRIIKAEAQPWLLKTDKWVEAEYDVPADAWYFKANHQSSMPFCVILEIALQTCGWLAAYSGSALQSDKDLHFRNLGGSSTLHDEVLPNSGTLTMRARMTDISKAGGMIIERFDMEIKNNERLIYEGQSYFGFFSKESLAEQLGIQDAEKRAYIPSSKELARNKSLVFQAKAPLNPDDCKNFPAIALDSPSAMPSNALRMIDKIEIYIPDGGPHNLGFIKGIKKVNPDEWFFKAHFFQDPVCPGSLGIESFLQLLKFIALDKWSELAKTHRFEPLSIEPSHNWVFRGQIIPSNKIIEVEAVITDIQENPYPLIKADGFLKVDGLFIYEMKNFGLRMLNLT
ncbi:3-hydroxyacyl-(acyl-carrier protein) dehydratase / trans-2-decenoyl-(acyl-carrier protein) isomerase [Candidatus Magnetomoraceae bacterium gMMP-1]